MVGAFGKKNNFRVRNIAVGSCPPIFDDTKDFVSPSRLSDCRSSSEVARHAINSFNIILISADWLTYQGRSAQLLDTFFETIATLEQEGKKIIIIGKAPVFDRYDRRCREKALSYPLLDCPVSTAPLTADVATTNAKLKAFAERSSNVKFFDPSHYLCPQGACSAFDGFGRPSYYDASHLSMPASWALGDAILRQGGTLPPFDLLPATK